MSHDVTGPGYPGGGGDRDHQELAHEGDVLGGVVLFGVLWCSDWPTACGLVDGVDTLSTPESNARVHASTFFVLVSSCSFWLSSCRDRGIVRKPSFFLAEKPVFTSLCFSTFAVVP